MIKPLIIAISLIAPSHSYCAEWWSIGAQKDRLYFMDISSMKSAKKNFKSAWVSYVYDNQTSKLALISFDCRSIQFRVDSTTLYNADGIATDSDSEKTDYMPITPETVISRIHSVACSNDARRTAEKLGGIKFDSISEVRDHSNSFFRSNVSSQSE